MKLNIAPPSPPVAKDDLIRFGVVGGDVKLGDALSTIDGPYCYIYE